MRIISFGFICCGPRSFLKDNWNILDFVIVIVSSISLAPTINLGIFKVLRVLRPLKMIRRNVFLKIAISSLFASIP